MGKVKIDMLMTYLQIGISTFIYLIPKAFIVFCVFTSGKFLFKRKIEFNLLSMICEFAWILTVLVILVITGIMGGNFSTTSIFNGNVHFSFIFFEEGLSMATLLNVTLFIPFGFFSPIVFKKLQNKWVYGILIGFIFSIAIEFLQTFTGRFAQLDDVLMDTLGTFLGYEIWFLLSKLKLEYKQKNQKIK